MENDKSKLEGFEFSTDLMDALMYRDMFSGRSSYAPIKKEDRISTLTFEQQMDFLAFKAKVVVNTLTGSLAREATWVNENNVANAKKRLAASEKVHFGLYFQQKQYTASAMIGSYMEGLKKLNEASIKASNAMAAWNKQAERLNRAKLI